MVTRVYICENRFCHILGKYAWISTTLYDLVIHTGPTDSRDAGGKCGEQKDGFSWEVHTVGDLSEGCWCKVEQMRPLLYSTLELSWRRVYVGWILPEVRWISQLSGFKYKWSQEVIELRGPGNSLCKVPEKRSWRSLCGVSAFKFMFHAFVRRPCRSWQVDPVLRIEQIDLCTTEIGAHRTSKNRLSAVVVDAVNKV